MIRFALLGCGRIGAMHAHNLARAPGVELAAVYDPVAAATAPLGARYGCRVAADPADALRGVDAVLIATSTPTHADLIELAAGAGRAILCEKPIDLSLERVRRCRDAVANSGVPIQIGFNRRFDPGFRAARDARAAGEIGQLEQVVITSRDPGMAPRDYLAASGGLFRDMTIHDFDLARFFLGEEPETVFAAGSALVDPALGAELDDVDSAMIVMRTASGKLCHINNSRRAVYGYDQRAELHGSDGMLRAENRRGHELRRSGRGATEAAEPLLHFFIERYAAAYEAEIASFVAAVRDGAPVEATFEDGYRALVLAEAALASMRGGAAVAVASIG